MSWPDAFFGAALVWGIVVVVIVVSLVVIWNQEGKR